MIPNKYAKNWSRCQYTGFPPSYTPLVQMRRLLRTVASMVLPHRRPAIIACPRYMRLHKKKLFGKFHNVMGHLSGHLPKLIEGYIGTSWHA